MTAQWGVITTGWAVGELRGPVGEVFAQIARHARFVSVHLDDASPARLDEVLQGVGVLIYAASQIDRIAPLTVSATVTASAMTPAGVADLSARLATIGADHLEMRHSVL